MLSFLRTYIGPRLDFETPLSHRPKQGANFAWGQQSGAWGRAGNANLLGVGLSLLGMASK